MLTVLFIVLIHKIYLLIVFYYSRQINLVHLGNDSCNAIFEVLERLIIYSQVKYQIAAKALVRWRISVKIVDTDDCNLSGIITTILSLQNGDYFNMSDWIYMASVSVYRSYAKCVLGTNYHDNHSQQRPDSSQWLGKIKNKVTLVATTVVKPCVKWWKALVMWPLP